MRKIPNLQTAIEECRRIGVDFSYEWTNKSHFKFYINGCNKVLIFNGKRDNKDKVRKDIRRIIENEH